MSESQGLTITLRGTEWPVKDPESPSMAIDVFANGHSIRSTGAVVALCCPKVAKRLKIGTLRDHRYDVMSYGGAAYDEMIRQGCTIAEIQAAALVCLDVLGQAIPKLDEEVQTEVDFSEATP